MPPNVSRSRLSGVYACSGYRHFHRFDEKKGLSGLVLTSPHNSSSTNFVGTGSQNHPLSRKDVCHFCDSPKSVRDGVASNHTSDRQHWFKNWQEFRNSKLTASTFAAAVGFWRGRRVQLWLEKLGLIEPFRGNMATCWSNTQEVVALERYKLITGNSVSFPEFRSYCEGDSSNDWLAASADGTVKHTFYGVPDNGVLEVKCPFFKGQYEKALPWTRVPPHYMPQAQGLLEILDKNWMDFYVWTPNGSSLFRVVRSARYWQLLKSALSDFWFMHVLPARELCRATSMEENIAEIRSLKPSLEHDLFNIILLESIRLGDEAPLLIREIHGKIVQRI